VDTREGQKVKGIDTYQNFVVSRIDSLERWPDDSHQRSRKSPDRESILAYRSSMSREKNKKKKI